MKLLSEIIDLLSSSEPSIQNALFKAQVLAHHLGETEMAAWVGSELRGYAEDGDLPAYRILQVTVMGNLSNAVYRCFERADYCDIAESTNIGLPGRMKPETGRDSNDAS